MTEEEKTKELEILMDVLCDKDFSKNVRKVESWTNKLLSIYREGYRHKYSSIFYKLQLIFSNDDVDIDLGSTIGENLIFLSQQLQTQLGNDPDNEIIKDAIKGFNKFSDHINLEIGRYNFLLGKISKLNGKNKNGFNQQQYDELSMRIENVSGAVDKIRPVTVNAQKELDNLDNKLENNKISSITALTIFSAVVLAFSGGITFVSGVFQGISDVSPYRLVFIVSLIGFILFNTIFSLLFMVGKITGKSISTKCKYLTNSKLCIECGDGFCSKQYARSSVLCKIWHKYSYVLSINMVLLLFMYIVFVLWYCKIAKFTLFKFLFIILPFFMIICILCFNKLNTKNYRNRIILNEKINLVEQYLYPKTDMLGLTTIFTNLLRMKDVNEDFSDLIKNSFVNDIKDYKRLIDKIDLFIEENIVLSNNYEMVSYSKHIINKKKWKVLFNELQNRLIK